MIANPRRIAVFQALNLGDLLCTTPALRALRQSFPAAEITFIGRPWAKELIERLGTVDRILDFPGFPGIAESPPLTPTPLPVRGERGLLAPDPAQTRAPFSPRTGRRAGDEGRFSEPTPPPFDLAIQMHGSGEVSNGFVATLVAAHSLGYGLPGDARLTQTLPWIEDEPEPLRWLRLVEAAGARSLGAAIEFPVTQAERDTASALLGTAAGQPLIGLHVGSSLPDRRWPAASFARLGDALADRFGARIALTGSAAEQPLTAEVRQSMRSPAVELAGKTSLGEFAAVIAALDLLVTNDTGASHVAAATRTRSVVLYGPSRPARWAPLDRELHRRIDAAAIVAARDGADALQALPVESVLAECVTMLDAIDPTTALIEERIAWAG